MSGRTSSLAQLFYRLTLETLDCFYSLRWSRTHILGLVVFDPLQNISLVRVFICPCGRGLIHRGKAIVYLVVCNKIHGLNLRSMSAGHSASLGNHFTYSVKIGHIALDLLLQLGVRLRLCQRTILYQPVKYVSLVQKCFSFGHLSECGINTEFNAISDPSLSAAFNDITARTSVSHIVPEMIRWNMENHSRGGQLTLSTGHVA